MLERARERFGLQPVSVTTDKSYGTGEFLSWLSHRRMTPYIPALDRKQQTNGFYTQRDFTHLPDENAYRCPAGPLLHPIGLSRVLRALHTAPSHRNAKTVLLSLSALRRRVAIG